MPCYEASIEKPLIRLGFFVSLLDLLGHGAPRLVVLAREVGQSDEDRQHEERAQQPHLYRRGAAIIAEQTQRISEHYLPRPFPVMTVGLWHIGVKH